MSEQRGVNALVDPQRFCGQRQTHWPHRWVTPDGFYAACSGKACSCVTPPEPAKPHHRGVCWCDDYHDREDFL